MGGHLDDGRRFNIRVTKLKVISCLPSRLNANICREEVVNYRERLATPSESNKNVHTTLIPVMNLGRWFSAEQEEL